MEKVETVLKREEIRLKEKELTRRRGQILAKLSQEDQEELAHVDLEWDELKELKTKLD